MRLSALQGLLLTAGLLLLTAPSASAAIGYVPCTQPAGFDCGTLTVPLDRTGAVPGAIQLAAVRRAAAVNPTRTAVVALAGGPGQAALPLALDFAAVMAPALATRDLLVFDQRGTGASTPLTCQLRGPTLTASASRCAGELGPRRGQFTTSASVDDLEALRSESGYEKLVLYGVSYGTKVALDYAARYPTRVESIVLDSVVLPPGPDTLQRSTFAAMRRVLNDLCTGGACAGISSNPVGQLNGQVRRLERKSLRGRLTDGRGRRIKAAMSSQDLFNIMLSGDLNPTLRAELPAALTSSRRGDSAPLIRLAARSAGIIELGSQAAGSDFSDPVFAATICEEGAFPWNRAASIPVRAQQARAVVKALGDAPFYPFVGASILQTEVIDLCLGWPTATPPAAVPTPLPAVPTLVIDGAADLRTPLEDAGQIATLIPGAQILPIPYTGHSALASDNTPEKCALRGVAEFFAAQPVEPCATGGNPFSPTPVAPTRLARLPGTGGANNVGRTTTAALRTAADMRRQVIGDLIEAGQLPRRLGGLRGGRATVSPTGTITLTKVVYVPGVEVSGTVPLDAGAPQNLRVGGKKAAHGTLVITPAQITGQLGGRRVDLVARSAGVRSFAGEPPYRALLRHFRLRHAG
ncbi:MAG TPA: alpha/beta fold hydrolase [Solirubrobacteraceae bacterium]|jgi:pimeloyl-ACP methyl ester carboxylesterase|nr:alpha/beta fold hydrolase [Solirubrobacteraceae bacterium]